MIAFNSFFFQFLTDIMINGLNENFLSMMTRLQIFSLSSDQNVASADCACHDGFI